MIRIRLQRKGRKKRPIYHLVVADSRSARDGRIIEQVGRYDNVTENKEVVLNEDRILYWLQTGAQPSDTVRKILRNSGLLYKRHLIMWGKSEEEIEAAMAEWKSYRDSKDDGDASRKDTHKTILAAEEKEFHKQVEQKAAEAAKEVAAKKAKEEEAIKAADAPEAKAEVAKEEEPKVEKPEAAAKEEVAETKEEAVKKAPEEKVAEEPAAEEVAEEPAKVEAEVVEETKEEEKPAVEEPKAAAEEKVTEAKEEEKVAEEPAKEEVVEETKEEEKPAVEKPKAAAEEKVAEVKEEEKAADAGQTSADMTAKDAAEHIRNTDLADLKGFVADDESRKTVLSAWESKQPDK